MNPSRGGRVLAVLDDASAALALLEASCALAQLMQRELLLVYVESAAALTAAALPATRVLAQPANAWAPLTPEDVELGWRVQASRVRSLADRLSTRRAVSWSMRVMRGALQPTANALREQTDLLLVAGAPQRFTAVQASATRPLIVALDDGGAPGREAVQVAQRLARALGSRLEVIRLDAGQGLPWLAAAGLVVAPAESIAAPALANLRAPLLLVGAPA